MIAIVPHILFTGHSSHSSHQRRQEQAAKAEAAAKAAAKAKADAYWLDNGAVCVDAPLPVQPPPDQTVVAVSLLIFLALGVSALYFVLRDPPARHWSERGWAR